MGAIFLFLLAVLSAIAGLLIFLTYVWAFIFVGFIATRIAIFYFYGVGFGLAWLALWWIGSFLLSRR